VPPILKTDREALHQMVPIPHTTVYRIIIRYQTAITGCTPLPMLTMQYSLGYAMLRLPRLLSATTI